MQTKNVLFQFFHYSEFELHYSNFVQNLYTSLDFFKNLSKHATDIAEYREGMATQKQTSKT